jgi:hypothetical protein
MTLSLSTLSTYPNHFYLLLWDIYHGEGDQHGGENANEAPSNTLSNLNLYLDTLQVSKDELFPILDNLEKWYSSVCQLIYTQTVH